MIPVMGDRMSAAGRLVVVGGVGTTKGGTTGPGSVVPGAEALVAAGAALPVPEAGGCGVAAPARAVAPEAGVAVGLAVTEDREVRDAAAVAAPADEAADDVSELAAAWPADVAAAGAACPPEAAVG
jgi:hypothetical protein